MDERSFAAAFPRVLWMPSRDVAKVGIDDLAADRGTVIAGLPNLPSTFVVQALPRRLLMSLLVNQHPALGRNRRSA
ncbi:hypothetical protein NIIDNTM18_06590 [Mycolicibacterium litorale]|uniref:Uncharacterized protein n=1 Tax=Mycolicibacterium litorale TaxID=758802 RepID=A0A6S6P1I3_9MYCO|nr:hypothetical protein NIIDNTM18_06590 [Mycolicibacterium litorale]